MRGAARTVAAVLCALALSLFLPATARADSAGGGDLHVAQTLGDRELTFVLRRVTGLPGPLHVDVLTHRGTPAGALRLGAVPAGVAADRAAGATVGTVTSKASVRLGDEPGTYGTVLDIDRAGPWELVVEDGSRTARIPFVVPGQVTSPPERTVFAGFVAAGVLMLVTLFVAVRARRGSWVLLPASGVVAALATAVTAALLSASLPPPPEPGRDVDATQDNVTDPYAVVRPVSAEHSRPPASLETAAYTARPGERGTLRLDVNDGSTGLPADDLVVHDGALMHLVVIGPAGRLWHLHPVRTAPGTYEVQLRLPASGHYAVSAEFARRGGGLQHVRSATGLTVTGRPAPQEGSGKAPDQDAAGADTAPASELAARGTGTRTTDGVPVRLTASTLTAGSAATLTARVGDTATLQPWLGMVGHMIVVGPLSEDDATGTTRLGQAAEQAPVWAHAHSMGGDMSGDTSGDMSAHTGGDTGTGHGHGSGAAHGEEDHAGHGTADPPDTEPGGHGEGPGSMSGLMPLNGDSPADETVAAYGPDVSFVYTFSRPGHYRVWIQAMRDSTVLTIPYVLHVSSGGSGGGEE
ncbi:hypothetical protein ACWF8U_02135 [Streptomyces olivaceus]|uniref:hypothetical protein n=1 Tax=Streptomyces TaxID=1883 RepID=UPI001CC9CB82|nr:MULTISPECIES: hypothetical protein [Streptomyces]MBZ6285067.1 hypothetical protein [Streptomyces olivaceus]MCC2269041.1 hypothetical protein [Streptomyces sp. CT1-17]